jgi:hypothetical protein
MSIRIAAAAVMAAAIMAFASASPSDAAGRYHPGMNGGGHGGGHHSSCSPGHWGPGCPGGSYHGHRHGHGYGYGYNFGFYSWPFYGGYYPYYGGYYGDGYYGNRYYDDGYSRNSVMSCRAARNILANRGYSYITTRDCVGHYYSFNGSKNGHKYRLSVNAVTGRYSRTMLH